MRRTLVPAFVLAFGMASDVLALMPMPLGAKEAYYDDIDAPALFVVGILETATPFAGMLVWRVRVERVVKGDGNPSFVYVATSPEYNKNPFGRERKLGSRVFLGLEATRLRVPAAAKPEAKADDTARAKTTDKDSGTKCYTIGPPAEWLDKSDSYFRCAILYYETRKELEKKGLEQRKAKLRELSKELESLMNHLQDELGEKGVRAAGPPRERTP